jgi:hypothetical protein
MGKTVIPGNIAFLESIRKKNLVYNVFFVVSCLEGLKPTEQTLNFESFKSGMTLIDI